MPYAKNGDINIYYEVHGEGEPLVLIPGMQGGGEHFTFNLPALSKHFMAITVDNRGAGLSDKPDIPYTFGMMASDIACLLDTLNIDKVHILGVSMGSLIAQHFVLDYPERVTSVILGATEPGGSHSVGLEELKSTQQSPEESAKMTREERVKSALALNMSIEFIENNPEFIDEIVSNLLSKPSSPIGAKRQYEAYLAHDTYERLPELEAPTLVIAGEKDAIFNPENSRIVASRIPNSELIIMKNMGHGFSLEALDETNKIFLDFLKRHSQK